LSLLLFFRPQFRVRLGDLTSALESSSCIGCSLQGCSIPYSVCALLGLTSISFLHHFHLSTFPCSPFDGNDPPGLLLIQRRGGQDGGVFFSQEAGCCCYDNLLATTCYCSLPSGTIKLVRLRIYPLYVSSTPQFPGR
jgi:hypothetical protein